MAKVDNDIIQKTLNELKTKNSSKGSEDLLIEIGVEELPPKNLAKFANSFAQNLEKAFNHANLSFAKIETFIAPRRIAARIEALATVQPEQTVVKRGPAKAAAFDAKGNPTQAALGFASACQTTIDKIQIQDTEKGAFLVFEQEVKGQATTDLIPKMLEQVLQQLPIAKNMRWGDRSETFVRPVHWLTLLYGEKVIPAEVFGITADTTTRGHRFHHPGKLALAKPSDYETKLSQVGKVIPSYQKRRQLIEAGLLAAAKTLRAHALIDEELLDQVTGLVEWPVILTGEFNAEFLSLPKEVLISAMQVHQKCFPIVDENTKLMAKFLIVSNIESLDPKTVIKGNERVMHARLQDAAFYYREDTKVALEERVLSLKQVIFQHGLGSLWDKAERIAKLASFINAEMQLQPSNAKTCEQAAMLCKTDLLTQMVLEFPELQGIMGRYYYLAHHKVNAKANAKDELSQHNAIAKAIEEHYHPRFADDRLPTTGADESNPNSLLPAIIAIADRLDTLVGLFGLGKRPTGDKDPFALRRQALAMLRIIIEEPGLESFKHIDLEKLFLKAKEIYADLLKTSNEPLVSELLDFCFERLRAYYLDPSQAKTEEIPARVFDAVLARRPTKPRDFHLRLQAVNAFQKLPQAESLSAANKRIKNILEKSAGELPEDIKFNAALLKEEAEKDLAQLLQAQEPEIKKLIKNGNYTEALTRLATFKEPVDRFFDSVMVMVEDTQLRNNRLKLLQDLRALFLEIADISVL